MEAPTPAFFVQIRHALGFTHMPAKGHGDWFAGAIHLLGLEELPGLPAKQNRLRAQLILQKPGKIPRRTHQAARGWAMEVMAL